MRFQVTERINSNAPITDIGASMQSNFSRIATYAKPIGHTLRVKSIQATFGSINRTDQADITIKPTDGGYLLIADVEYRPSAAFWIILVLGAFTTIFWLLPIFFYLSQKESVKRGIEEGFRNVKNEFTTALVPSRSQNQIVSSSSIADLEKLGALLTQGLLTQDEFNQQKNRILSSLSTTPIGNDDTTNSAIAKKEIKSKDIALTSGSPDSKKEDINEEQDGKKDFSFALAMLSKGDIESSFKLLRKIAWLHSGKPLGIQSQELLKSEQDAYNAYLQGKSLYDTKSFDNAIMILHSVVQQFPETLGGAKAKDILNMEEAAHQHYKKALESNKHGRKEETISILQSIVSKYPQTSHAEKAQRGIRNSKK